MCGVILASPAAADEFYLAGGGQISGQLLNASQEGLTTKGQTPITLNTEVVLELNPEGTPFAVRGRIAHCTETLGGFKIGIELRFE